MSGMTVHRAAACIAPLTRHPVLGRRQGRMQDDVILGADSRARRRAASGPCIDGIEPSKQVRRVRGA